MMATATIPPTAPTMATVWNDWWVSVSSSSSDPAEINRIDFQELDGITFKGLGHSVCDHSVTLL